MELGCEVKAHESVHIRQGNSIKTVLMVDGKELIESKGSDHYGFNVTIIPGHRLAATGRGQQYLVGKMPADWGVMDADPCCKVEIPSMDRVELKITTDIMFNHEQLPKLITLILSTNSQEKDITLHRPDLFKKGEEPGTFLIDLTPAIDIADR